jgi:hypothetical protein
MANIFDKINKLSNQFKVDGQDAPDSLKNWANEAKEAQLYVHLLQFDGMIKFLANLQTDIENINTKLAGDRNMDEAMRQYLFGEKDAKYQIIQFFKGKEKSLIDLEKRVNNELSD